MQAYNFAKELGSQQTMASTMKDIGGKNVKDLENYYGKSATESKRNVNFETPST